MSTTDSIAALESRRNRLQANFKNIDSKGVIRKINREIRNKRKAEAKNAHR